MILLTSSQVGASQPALLTAEQRVEGVSIIWRQISEQFPIRDRVGVFKTRVDLTSQEVKKVSSDAEYYAALDRLVASLNDGHTFVMAPAGVGVGRSKPSVGVELVEGRPVVTWVRNDLAKDIPLGSSVVAVDGKEPFQIASERTLSVSASTANSRRDIAVSRILEGESGSLVTIDYITPLGEQRTKSLERGDAWPEGTKLVFLRGIEGKRTDFRTFDRGEISYFSARDFRDYSIYSAFAENLSAIRSSRAIIFDVRRNSGGNSRFGIEVLSHFLTAPTAVGATRKTSARIAAEESNLGKGFTGPIILVEKPQGVIQPRTESERISIPLVILTDHDTVSAAEDFVSFASALGAMRVGEDTAGSTGEMARVALPGGGTLFALIKWDKSATGDEFVGLGFRPHVPSSPTVSDLVGGRDTILTRGLEIARGLMR
jgi:C-terminal processing protease CtpA/Prc